MSALQDLINNNDVEIVPEAEPITPSNRKAIRRHERKFRVKRGFLRAGGHIR